LYERNVEEHRAIRQALAAGSASGARALAREHVMNSYELLTTILEHVEARGSTFSSVPRATSPTLGRS
jgi:DNA-binding GntR family transcriptional regulator